LTWLAGRAALPATGRSETRPSSPSDHRHVGYDPGVAITDEERRAVARWAADSAECVLPLFEAIAPSDARPREAIDTARAFANGERRTRRLFEVALAAHRAGRQVGDPIGLAVARAASLAAANANLHDETTIGTLGHILGSAAYAALARELASGGDRAAADEEMGWAIEHASAAIRDLVRRVPVGAVGRRRLDALQHQLEMGLRR
jgi:immunity protein 5 of polymorphic toxin system